MTGRGAQTVSETMGDREEYHYAHLLPHFSQVLYPPLTPFHHVDPGTRALAHPNPRVFLNTATEVVDMTPNLGTEVRGLHLADLDSEGRDQLALEVPVIYTAPWYLLTGFYLGRQARHDGIQRAAKLY